MNCNNTYREPSALADGLCARIGRVGQAHIDLFVPQHNPLCRVTTDSDEAT